MNLDVENTLFQWKTLRLLRGANKILKSHPKESKNNGKAGKHEK